MEPAKYSAIDIAMFINPLINREAGDSITNLMLQKILFYAEAWTLVELNQQLFHENILAKEHGPIVQEVFSLFESGSQIVTIDFFNNFKQPPVISEEVYNILNQILLLTIGHSSSSLETKLKREWPYLEARLTAVPKYSYNGIINKLTMREFYKQIQIDQMEGDTQDERIESITEIRPDHL